MYRRILAVVALALTWTGAAVAQQSGNAIKIGVLNDQSGLYAEFGGAGSVAAAKMAVEDFGGTVLGRRIEVLSADHQNKPDVASNIARQWLDVDGVEVFADLTNSAVSLAVQHIARERGKIALFSGPATTRLTNEDCSPTGFHWTFDTYSQAIGSARAVVQEGGKSWFLLVADYAFGHQMAADLANEVTTGGGPFSVRSSIRVGRATSRPTSCRLKPPRRRSSGWQMAGPTPSTRSSKLASSASLNVVRSSWVSCWLSATFTPLA